MIEVAKMNLNASYRYAGKAYGPGENVEVPDEAAKSIRAYQKEEEAAAKAEASRSQNVENTDV